MKFTSVLHRNIPWFTFFLITSSLCLGMVIAVTCYISYTDIFTARTEDSALTRENYLVLNKSVGLLDMISGGGSAFSKREIEDLKAQEFIDEIAPFEAAQFRIKAYAPLHEERSFYTDLPLESVPSKFLDIGEGFNWKEGQKQLPIVIPNAYFKIYNFAFAPSQGLPQINEGTAKTLSIKMEMVGNGGTFTFWAKIHDFTDRVNSILVPQEFMDWANENIGKQKQKRPSRIIVSSTAKLDERLDVYISDKGYSTNQELLKEGKIASALKVIFSIEAFQGLLILFLSLGLILLSALLLVERNKKLIYKIRLQGISAKKVSKTYISYFIACVGIASLLALVVAFLLRSVYVSTFSELNISVEHSWWHILFCIFSLAILSSLLAYLVISKRVRKVL